MEMDHLTSSQSVSITGISYQHRCEAEIGRNILAMLYRVFSLHFNRRLAPCNTYGRIICVAVRIATGGSTTRRLESAVKVLALDGFNLLAVLSLLRVVLEPNMLEYIHYG